MCLNIFVSISTEFSTSWSNFWCSRHWC